MKNFFVLFSALCILCAVPVVALAARQVPGSVPETQPLQPMPVQAQPNVQNNIQSQPAGEGSPEGEAPSARQSKSLVTSPAPASAHARPNIWFMAISFIVAAAIIVYAVKHR